MTDVRPDLLTVAAFRELNAATDTMLKLKSLKRVQGVDAALVMRRDAAGRLSFEDVGLTPKHGAVAGAVLGGVVGVMTGGAGLALAALGGVLGNQSVKRRRRGKMADSLVDALSESLGPGCSAILIVGSEQLPDDIVSELEGAGADMFTSELTEQAVDRLEAHTDEANATLAGEVKAATEGRATVPYGKIHVIINPAAGKDEPILNTLNDAFYAYGIDWDVSITRRYGDATEFARRAAEAGADLVAGYGGDGTQHEVANGIVGTGVTMGVLPGGTGNGFCNELGVPQQLEPAVKLLCTGHNTREMDMVRKGDEYFLQRLYVGIEPEEQTSREDKNKYGTFAYAISTYRLARSAKDVPYTITIDGETIKMPANKVYVVNAAQSGTGISVTGGRSLPDDGLVDVFALSVENIKTLEAAAGRVLHVSAEDSDPFFWRGKKVTIDTDPDQPVWTDGEYSGRTPVELEVVPGALKVVVP